MDPCKRCGAALKPGAGFCPACGAPTQAGARPEPPPPQTGQRAAGWQNAPPATPYPNVAGTAPQAAKRIKPLHIALIAAGGLLLLVALGLAVFFALQGGRAGAPPVQPQDIALPGGAEPVQENWGGDIQPPQTQPQPQQAPASDAELYSFWTLSDSAMGGIEVCRVLLPDSWQLYGDVAWDMHSMEAPGYFYLHATSPDGTAGMLVLPRRCYANQQLGGVVESSVTAWGYPSFSVATPQQLAAQALADYVPGVSNPSFGAAADYDTNGAMAGQFFDRLPLDAVRQMGMELGNPFYASSEMDGTAGIGGVDSDVWACVNTSGYSIASYGSATSVTVDYWNVEGIVIAYAPAGQMQDYAPVFAMFDKNFQLNDGWVEAYGQMQAACQALVQQQQAESWAAARALSAQLSAQVDSVISHTNAYIASRDESMARISARFQDYMFDMNTYDMGGGEGTVRVGTQWDQVWVGADGTVLGTNDALYDPNTDPALNGVGWSQPQLLT